MRLSSQRELREEQQCSHLYRELRPPSSLPTFHVSALRKKKNSIHVHCTESDLPDYLNGRARASILEIARTPRKTEIVRARALINRQSIR